MSGRAGWGATTSSRSAVDFITICWVVTLAAAIKKRNEKKKNNNNTNSNETHTLRAIHTRIACYDTRTAAVLGSHPRRALAAAPRNSRPSTAHQSSSQKEGIKKTTPSPPPSCPSATCSSTPTLTAMTAARHRANAPRSSGERLARPSPLHERARGGQTSHFLPRFPCSSLLASHPILRLPLQRETETDGPRRRRSAAIRHARGGGGGKPRGRARCRDHRPPTEWRSPQLGIGLHFPFLKRISQFPPAQLYVPTKLVRAPLVYQGPRSRPPPPPPPWRSP